MSDTVTLQRACALPDSPLANVVAGLDACVHCGFCLQACPTYVTLEDENDSPRGRIVLMRALVDGKVALDDPVVGTHIARCLGCRGCETACPSGVPYGQLLEATRATLAQAQPIPPVARLILATFARRPLLRLAMLGSRLFRATGLPVLLSRLPGAIGFAMAMLASTRSPLDRSTTPRRPRSATGATSARGTATTLDGCVMDGLLTHVNRATERVLDTNGWDVVRTRDSVCCGALHAHAGDLDTARSLARTNVAAFERTNADVIAINSAGCGAMIKEYAHLLAADPEWAERARRVAERARDISEVMAESGPRRGGRVPLSVTYDAPCHLMHAQRVVRPPVQLLESIPGLDLVPLTDSDMCCGSAGIYNLIEPDTSDAVLAPKLARIAEAGVPLVATGNPGCMMQIGAGLLRARMEARVVHPVELLDRSYDSERA